MGAQRRKHGKPQYAGPHLRFSGRAGRRSARLSLLPFCQTASAFRLICLFHTFFRRGVYRAMVFAPLRCPKLFRFPFALFVGCSFCLFCSSLVVLYHKFTTKNSPHSRRQFSIRPILPISPIEIRLLLIFCPKKRDSEWSPQMTKKLLKKFSPIDFRRAAPALPFTNGWKVCIIFLIMCKYLQMRGI